MNKGQAIISVSHAVIWAKNNKYFYFKDKNGSWSHCHKNQILSMPLKAVIKYINKARLCEFHE